MSDLSTRYYLLSLLEKDSGWTQRELAHELGVSVGKAHYCLKHLINRGWVKVFSFKNNRNRASWRYHLTPDGRDARQHLMRRYLNHKLAELESLKSEIKKLRDEVKSTDGGGSTPPTATRQAKDI